MDDRRWSAWLRKRRTLKKEKRGKSPVVPRAERLEDRTVPTASLHWIGSSASNGNQWSVASNWAENDIPSSGASLTFDTAVNGFSATSNGFNPVNDLAALSDLEIVIADSSSAGDFRISGNSVAVSVKGIRNSGAAAEVALDVAVSSDSAWLVDGSTLTVSGSISGSGAVTKTGAGTLAFAGDNGSYAGAIDVVSGVLLATGATALGTTASGTTVQSGATLALSGGVTLASEPVNVAGTGVGGIGALQGLGGANSLTGVVTLAANATIGVPSSVDSLTLTNTVNMAQFGVTFTGAGNCTVNGALASSQLPGLDGSFYSLTTNVALLDTTAPVQGTFNLQDSTTFVPAFTKITPTIDFGLGTESTAGTGSVLDRAGTIGNAFGGIGVNVGVVNVEGLWTGKISISEEADYRFTTRSDDGSVIYVDGVRVVYNNVIQPMTNVSAVVHLTAGLHEITIGYFQTDDAWGVQASWERISGANQFTRQIIPSSVLFNDVATPGTFVSGGLKGQYFNYVSSLSMLYPPVALPINLQAHTPTVQQAINYIDFGAGTETVAGTGTAGDRSGSNGNILGGIGVNLGVTGVAAFLSGFFNAAVPGTYRFTTRSDDGSRLFVDGKLVVDNDFVQPMTNRSGTISLSAGPHSFAMGYFELSSSPGVQGVPWGLQAFWERDLGGGTYTARKVLGPDVLTRGDGATNTLVKTGSGTLTLNGASVYQGGTALDQGTLLVGNAAGSALGSGSVTVATGAIIGGAGSFSGAVAAARAVRPGTNPGSTGALASGPLAFSTGGSLTVDLNGLAAGTQYDQLKVAGSVTLAGAALIVNLGYVPASGDVFTIIDNDGVEPVSGTFANLPQGSTFAIGGQTFQINYAGGVNNNDVILSVANGDLFPAFTSPATATFAAGVANTFTVSASGTPLPTLTKDAADALPSGVTFDPATGVLSGAPALSSLDTYVLHFAASNGVDSPSTQTFTLHVSQAPTITSAASATFVVGVNGTFNVAASGYPAATFTASGTLPAGVTLSSNGLLSGAPAATGVYSFTVTASNGILPASSQTFTLTVNQIPAMTSGNRTTFTIGSSNSFSTTATGTPAPTFSRTGTLPTGVTFSSAGVLSGIPAAHATGIYPITIAASNSAGASTPQSFTLTVVPASGLHWIGGAGADGNLWSVASNWLENIVPDSGYTLNFDTASAGFSVTANGFNPVNDLTALSNLTIKINDSSSGGDFRLSGNSFGLSANGVTSAVSVGAGAEAALNLSAPSATSFAVSSGWLNVSGVIGGSGTFSKTGTGTLILGGNNSAFAGSVNVAAGTLLAANPHALGTVAAGTTVASGATLSLSGGITLDAEPLTIGGAGVGGEGALQSVAGANVVTGPIVLTTNFVVGVPAAADRLTITGDVQMAQFGVTVAGAGDTTITGILNAGQLTGIDAAFYATATSTGTLDSATFRPIGLQNTSRYVPAVTKITSTIDFGAGTETTPGNGSVLDRSSSSGNFFGGIGVNLGTSNVEALWTGMIQVSEEADYRFTTRNDDGATLYIDEKRIVHSNYSQLTNSGGTVHLTAGLHSILIGYYRVAGAGAMQWSWERVSGSNPFARQIVPADVLFNDFATPGTFVSGGLKGRYFSAAAVSSMLEPQPTLPINLQNSTTYSPAVVKITPTIDFGAGTELSAGNGSVLDRSGTSGNPFGGIGVNIGTSNIEALWTGKIQISEDADYRFTLRNDDGATLFVDESSVVHANAIQSMANTSGIVHLAAGLHSILIGFYQTTGPSGMQLSWERISGTNQFARQIVPASALFNDVAAPGTFVSGGLKGQFFNVPAVSSMLEPQVSAMLPMNVQLLAPSVQKVVNYIDFGAGTETVAGTGTAGDRNGSMGNILGGIGVNLGTDSVAAVFSGFFVAPQAGLYRFTTRSDDGSRLFIDGNLVVENDFIQFVTNRSGTVNLSAGPHGFLLGYFEGNNAAGNGPPWGIQAFWERDQGGGNYTARTVLGPDVLRVLGSNTLTKNGSGKLTVAGANTFSGGTTINQGTLLVNNTTGSGLGNGNVTVAAGATLGGQGTTAGAVSAGTLSPGSVPGAGTQLNVGSLTFAAGGKFTADLASASQFDQLFVTGTVTLAGTLDVSLGFAPTIGSTFKIIDNDGSDPVVGAFQGLAQGAKIYVGTRRFHINYSGGDGNDVVLTVDLQVANLSPIVVDFEGGLYGTFTASAPLTPTPSFSVVGPLPPGLAMSSAGVLSGTPTALGSFLVTLVADNGAGSAATQSLTIRIIDVTLPTATISAQPPLNVNATSATFQFFGTDPAPSGVSSGIRHLEFQADGSDFVQAQSPVTLTNLAEGQHTSRVRAVDNAGNVGTATSYVWTIDLTPPTTSISSQPLALNNSTNASFTFAGTDPTAGGVASGVNRLEYSLNGGAFAAAPGTISFSGLALGTHAFQVRAVDNAGNVGIPVSYAWTIEQTLPRFLSIVSTPPISTATNASSVSFTVTFSEAVAGVDAADFVALTTGALTAGVPQVTGSGTVWNVELGVVGDGTVKLKLVDDGSIRDLAGNPLTALLFRPAISYAAGMASSAVPVADFNSDGIPDLAFGENGLGIALGNGDGTFHPPVTFEAAFENSSAFSGDFNGDLIPDLAMFAQGGSQAAVLLGNGDATFKAPRNVTLAANTTAMCVADFDNDGKLDIVAGHFSGINSTISVVRGNGNGTFKPRVTYSNGFASPLSIAIADVDNDNVNDVVVGNSDNVRVFLGNVDGSLKGPIAISVFALSSIALGEVNNDGKTDLVATTASGVLRQHLGNGNGTFRTATTFASPNLPNAILATDVNGDGKTDLVLGKTTAAAIGVLLGNGNGTYATEQTFAANDNVSANVQLTLADLDRDGLVDLVAPSLTSKSISVFLREGSSKPYTVDQTAPSATITAHPPLFTISSSASFGVSANDPVVGGVSSGLARMEVRLDDGDFTAASSPVNFTGLSVGEHVFSVRGVDQAGNVGAAATYSWTVLGPPTVTSIVRSVPVGPFTNASSVDYVVTFSEPVDGLDSADFVVTRTGSASSSAASLVALSDRSYRLTVSLITGDGTLRLDVVDNGSIASSATGLPLGSAADGGLQGEVYSIDHTGPTTTIDAMPPLATATRSATFDFSAVDPSEGGVAAGVDRFEYQFDFGGFVAASAPVTLSGLAVGGHVFQVRAIDALGNVGNAASYSWTVVPDPRVLSVTPNGASPTNAASVTFNVTFDAPVVGVDAADFALATTGSVAAVVSEVSGGGAAYVVTVSAITGDGLLGLNLVDNGTVFGVVGSAPLGGDGPGNGDFAGASYLIDQVAPRLVSIVRAAPTGSPTSATSVTYAVTFDEPVVGVDAADFEVVSSGSAVSTSLQVSGSGATYLVVVGGVAGSGALRLDLVDDDDSIADVAGNPLANRSSPDSFEVSQTFAAMPGASAVTTADLDGDGALDAIETNSDANVVSIMLGAGGGGLGAPQTFAVGNFPVAVVVADVDADGRPDLVVVDRSGAGVSLLLGNGDGTFQNQQTFGTGVRPTAAAIADVNGDGHVDVVAVNAFSNNAAVLLGNGDGTFQPLRTFGTGGLPAAVAIGDVSGDGELDLVVVNQASRSISVLRGDGAGHFGPHATFAIGASPSSLSLADVDGDGSLDVVVANTGEGSIGVLLDLGDGTFAPQATYGVGSLPRSLAVADVSGDGTLDVVVGSGGAVGVLRGRGNGTFEPQTTFATGASATSLSLGDVNGDGAIDVLIASESGVGGVLFGTPAGSVVGQSYVVDPSAPLDPLDVPRPTVTGIGTAQVLDVVPFVGPTSGGTTVVLSGVNFLGVTAVRFGGTDALSYTVHSAKRITAVAPPGRAGLIDVTVTNLAGTSSTSSNADDYTYAAPAITSAVVNGGPIAARDRFGKAPDLANQNSVVAQLLVTFNQRVTLDAGAFQIVSAGGLTATGATPSSASVAVIATGVESSGDSLTGYQRYVLTFAPGAGVHSFDLSASGGNAFTTLQDGSWRLETTGSKVHAGGGLTGGDTAADHSNAFWSLFGVVAPGAIIPSSDPAAMPDSVRVDGLALSHVYAAFGSRNDAESQSYTPAFDSDLDGDVDGIDLGRLYANFGAIWKF